MKPGDLVTVDKGFAGKHGSGIVIATRSRYPNDPREEELVATVKKLLLRSAVAR